MNNLTKRALAAISICASLAACGSKGGDSHPAAAAKPKTVADRTGGTSNGAPAPSSPTKNSPAADTETLPAPNSINQGKMVAAKSSIASELIDVTPASVPQVQQMSMDSKNFSGSADDYLRTYLQLKQDQVKDSAARAKNLALASSIFSASLKIDYAYDGKVDVVLNIGANKDNLKTVYLSGYLDSNRKAVVRSSNNKSAITGTLQCMDLVTADGPTCETSFLDVTTAHKGNLKVIFRRTNVALYAKFPDHNCKTSQCEEMYLLFRQTQQGIIDQDTVKKAKLESFEVIQGRSAFHLVLLSNASQVITVAGPLVSPEVSPITNIPADRTLRVEDMVDLQTMDNYKTDLQSSLTDVRIVGNNGRGKITLQVKMKMQDDGLRDQFQLELNRMSRDLMPIIESSGNISLMQ